GNDPDAVLQAAELAVSFRQAFAKDVVVDLVCYRRNGHNEFDEPRFTQPVEYDVIDRQDSVTALYRQKLIKDGIAIDDVVDRRTHEHRARFEEAFRNSGRPPEADDGF